MKHRVKSFVIGTCAAFAWTAASSGAAADTDSCREWTAEHAEWKAEVMRRYLTGAPQRELDAALFEMLQREAYLTSCEVSVERGRSALIGWRLMGRVPEEYGSAVSESVLECAGFDLDLRKLFVDALPEPAPPPRRASRKGARLRGARDPR